MCLADLYHTSRTTKRFRIHYRTIRETFRESASWHARTQNFASTCCNRGLNGLIVGFI